MAHGSDLLFGAGSGYEVGQGLDEDAHWFWPFWSWFYRSLLQNHILDLLGEFVERDGKSGVVGMVEDFILLGGVSIYDVNIVGLVHFQMLCEFVLLLVPNIEEQVS